MSTSTPPTSGRNDSTTTTGRGGKSHGRGQNPGNRIAVPTVTKFKGHTIALSGFIFDCSDYKQADVYTTTLKRIAEYVGAEYKHGGDISASITNGKLMNIPEPAQPPDYVDRFNVTRAEKLADIIFSKKLDAHIRREDTLHDNVQKAYALILGQCTDLLQTKLK